MSKLTIAYAPRPDTTAEGELSSLASVYKLILDTVQKKEAAPESRPNDAKERSVHDSRASTNYTG